MEPVDGGYAVKEARCDNCFGPACRSVFFCRLTNKKYVAPYSRFHIGQNGSRTDKDGHVSIMAAGVHLTLCFRSKRESRIFLDGQSIHIRSQGNGRPRVIALKECRHPIAACDIFAYIKTESF